MLPLKFLHLQSGCSLTSTYTPIARPVRGSNSARRACTRGTPRRRTPQRSASVSAGRRPWAKRDWISCEAPTVRIENGERLTVEWNDVTPVPYDESVTYDLRVYQDGAQVL